MKIKNRDNRQVKTLPVAALQVVDQELLLVELTEKNMSSVSKRSNGVSNDNIGNFLQKVYSSASLIFRSLQRGKEYIWWGSISQLSIDDSHWSASSGDTMWDDKEMELV